MVGPRLLIGFRPVQPEGFGFGERNFSIDGLWYGLVRWEPGQHERHPIAGPDNEIGDRRQLFAVDIDRGAQADCVRTDRKSTRLNSSHANISYAVFCLKKKK